LVAGPDGSTGFCERCWGWWMYIKAALLCLECFELGEMQQTRSLNRRLQVKGNCSIFHADYKGKKRKRQGSNG